MRIALSIVLACAACGGGREAQRRFEAPDVLVSAIWGSSSSDVWFAGNANGHPTPHLYHFDGTAVSETALPGIPPAYLASIWGSGPSDVWIAGAQAMGGIAATTTQGILLHYDGKTWSADFMLDGFGSLTGVWGTAHDDVWAVGNGSPLSSSPADWRGVVLHSNGVGWLPVSTADLAPPGFRGVCGFAKDDVWAVGVAPAINSKNLHWDGKSFAAPAEAASADLFCVPGDGVYLVAGEVGSDVKRWDGRAQPSALDVGGRAVSLIYGRASGDVWIAGTKCSKRGLLGCEQTDYVAAWSGGSGFENVGFSGFSTPSDQAPEILAIFGTGEKDVWFSTPFALAHYP